MQLIVNRMVVITYQAFASEDRLGGFPCFLRETAYFLRAALTFIMKAPASLGTGDCCPCGQFC